MSWVMVAAGGVAAGTGLFKTIKGGKQIKKGEALNASNKLPTYTRPGEVTEALKVAENNYRNGMPGASAFRNDINASAASAFGNAEQGASSSADILDAATKINYNSNLANNNLAKQEVAFNQDAQRQYIGQLNNNATYADKEFNYNEDQPYQKTAAAASAMIGAGEQNRFNGLNEIGGAAAGALTGGLLGGGAKVFNPAQGDLDKLSSIPASSVMKPTSFNPSVAGKLIVDPLTGMVRMEQK